MQALCPCCPAGPQRLVPYGDLAQVSLGGSQEGKMQSGSGHTMVILDEHLFLLSSPLWAAAATQSATWLYLTALETVPLQT